MNAFPDSYHDNLAVSTFSGLTNEGLDYMVNEYGAFLQRDDLMARARTAGNRVLDHLLFELGYRDGIYEIGRMEDETCATA